MILEFYKRIKPAPKPAEWEDYFHGRETLLWEGAPISGIRGKPTLIFLTLFGLPFLGAGLFVSGGGLLTMLSFDGLAAVGGGLFMFLFGLPFLFVGLGMTVGTWIVAGNRHEFIRYGLSNKRAYIAQSWWNHTMESYPITADSYLEFEQGRTDAVWFSKLQSKDSDGDQTTQKTGFENIADGAKVYAMLRDIQEQRAKEQR